jgi:hypothetical protein
MIGRALQTHWRDFRSANWVIYTIVSSPSAQNGCHHQPKRDTKLSSHRKGVRLER